MLRYQLRGVLGGRCDVAATAECIFILNPDLVKPLPGTQSLHTKSSTAAAGVRFLLKSIRLFRNFLSSFGFAVGVFLRRRDCVVSFV